MIIPNRGKGGPASLSLAYNFARGTLSPLPGLGPELTFTRASDGWYFGTDRLLHRAAADVPRFDFDPSTGAALGLLIESAGTNILAGSNLIDDTSDPWLSSENFASITEVESVFESESAWQHEGDGIGNRSRRQLSGSTFVDGQTDALSVIVENVDSEQTQIAIRDATAPDDVHAVRYTWATRDLSTNFGTGEFLLEDLGTGPNGGEMVRITLTATGIAAGTGGDGNTVDIRIYPNSTAAVTTSCIVHHAQFETNVAASSSPIVTPDTTDVTRALELCTTTDLDWYNLVAGTFHVVARVGKLLGSVSIFPNMVAVNTGDANRIIVHGNVSAGGPFLDSKGVVTDTSVAQADLTDFGQDSVSLEMFTASFAWEPDDFRLQVNGGTPVVDASGTIPTVATFEVGTRDGGSHWNSHIKEVRYYAERLADDLLLELSSGNLGLPWGDAPSRRQPEANAVLARYSALDAAEIAAIEAFVNGMVNDGVWKMVTEVYVPGLNATDHLIGMVASTVALTGPSTHAPGIGVTFTDLAGHFTESRDFDAFNELDSFAGCFVDMVGADITTSSFLFGILEGADQARWAWRGNDTNDTFSIWNTTLENPRPAWTAGRPSGDFVGAGLRGTTNVELDPSGAILTAGPRVRGAQVPQNSPFVWYGYNANGVPTVDQKTTSTYRLMLHMNGQSDTNILSTRQRVRKLVSDLEAG